MKKIISIILALTPFALFAQTAERQVIGSNGGFTSTPSVQVSSTVGEAVTVTGTSATIILTQGFEQADVGTIGIEDIKTGLTVNAFPNPAKGLVMLQLNAPNAMELTVSVFDVTGRLTFLPLQKLKVNGASNHEVDFTSLSAGNYYLQLVNTEGTLKQTIKIQKVE